jgi:hypothetical protein
MFSFSGHSKLRLAQRHLSPSDIDYVLDYGQIYHRAGVEFYFLRRRDVPAWDQASEYYRLAGTAVLLSKDGQTLITTWRNQRGGLKHILRKHKGSARKDN